MMGAPALHAQEAQQVTPLAEVKIVADAALQEAFNAQTSLMQLQAPLDELPFTVQQIDIGEFRARGGDRLSDLQFQAPGVGTAGDDDNTNDLLTIRGIETLWVSVNGMQSLDLDTGVAEQLDNIERVEVIMGPAGVEAGSATPGGAVNLVTKKPSLVSARSLQVEAGSWDRYRVIGDATGAVGGSQSLSYRLVASGGRADDFRARRREETVLVAPSLQWQYAPGSALLVEWNYSNQNLPSNTGTIYVRGAGLEDDFAARRLSLATPGDFNKQIRQRGALYLTHRLNDVLEARLSYEARHTRRHARISPIYIDSLYDGGSYESLDFSDDPSAIYGLRLGHNTGRGQNLQAELRAHGRSGIFEHQLVTGISGQRHRLSQRRESGVGEYAMIDDVFDPQFEVRDNDCDSPFSYCPVRFDKRSVTSKSVFAQYKLDIAQRWHLVGGARHDRTEFGNVGQTIAPDENETDRFHSAYEKPSWRLGASYDLLPSVNLYGGYSDAYIYQQALLRNYEPAGPAHGSGGEVGIRLHSQDHRLSAQLGAYDLAMRDLAQPDPSDPDFILSVLIGKIRSRGVELQGRAERERWSVSAAAAYGKAYYEDALEDIEGKRLINSPQFSANSWIEYRFQLPLLGQTTSALGFIYGGSRPGDDANRFYLPAYRRFDLSLEGRLGRSTQWRLLAENLLDETYYTGVGYRPWGVWAGAPFNVGLQLTQTF